MAHPKVSDGGNGLQIWTVAANTLNTQLQTAHESGPLAWKLGRRFKTPHHKTPACYKMLYKVLNMVTGSCEHAMNLQVPLKGG
jgi:hypothetical protein